MQLKIIIYIVAINDYIININMITNNVINN